MTQQQVDKILELYNLGVPKTKIAKEKAAKTAKNAEFTVTPGQLFSSYTFNAKEVQASLS